MAQLTLGHALKTEPPQKLDDVKSKFRREFNSMVTQQEELRKATLLKHRKVSTQLKLDMVQRQMSHLRRRVHETESDRQFYRIQMAELSNELQDLGSTLEKVERNAYYTRRRMLRNYGVDAIGTVNLSASQPAIYSSSEGLDRSSRNNQKSRILQLSSSPTAKLKKKHLLGELRAVASLSSLNTKSSTQASYDDVSPKDRRSWMGPLKFLGNLVDSRLRRKFWSSTKRTKSEENIVDDCKPRSMSDVSHICNGLRTPNSGVAITYISSSSESDSSEDEACDEELNVTADAKNVGNFPSMTNVARGKAAQIDPALLAEIEDFEKMAAQYIEQHT